MNQQDVAASDVSGQFVDLDGQRYYQIRNVDRMAPFFISLVSSSNHWLFISSTGCLSAGRIRPENALFPYRSVDHIHENAENTGAKTVLRVGNGDHWQLWEPFNLQHNGLYQVERNLYKTTTGDQLLFEEINHSLQLRYRYSWRTCEPFGFVRHAELTNLADGTRDIELLDGLQNLLPSGAPLAALQTRSALVDAYKWNERIDDTSLALYTMYAQLSDRAEPAESLLATTVFSVDNDPHQILLSSQQLAAFRSGLAIEAETLTRGLRGSHFIHKRIELAARSSNQWYQVADLDQDHSRVSELIALQNQTEQLAETLELAISENQQQLIQLMSGADAWQLTEDESTSVHHYANVLFNNMRGGVFEHHYWLDKADVVASITQANARVAARHQALLASLPTTFTQAELVMKAKASGDAQLQRLAYEYLPLTFGRRHGDPSRPWNHFEIKLRDQDGKRLLSYQGNWRDIFQNWEAIALSYPKYIASFIAKFVNASTADGYNPYRITKQGIDWEIMDPDDPWSNIGYWGDHQIIYLLKFLELAEQFNRQELNQLLESECFSYANVPYRLAELEQLLRNPKDTVSFDDQTQALTEQRVCELGSDGKLLLNAAGDVYQVNLTEKVLVPLLAKLSNLVVDGGIWLNTQRPEWNDANNAIVGNGLSMVTLYYMRRYVAFLQSVICRAGSSISLSNEVADWITDLSARLQPLAEQVGHETLSPEQRMAVLRDLVGCGDRYRRRVYQQGGFSGKTRFERQHIEQLLSSTLAVLDASIINNQRSDGLYNAYNIVSFDQQSLQIEPLYPMLEGQVAVLSSGQLDPKQAARLLDTLFKSDIYRADQHSFMLYPDRQLVRFMDKNRIPESALENSALLQQMLNAGDERIIKRDLSGQLRFRAEFNNAQSLQAAIDSLQAEYPNANPQEWQQVLACYEQVFNHKAFTGRSGTMFGYEGLGCIYWHMVSKLLLAVQENYQQAFELDPTSELCQQLCEQYYRVRAGIGFNKSPQHYGAFPTDPYSHTPKHAGAQQPGMTGQVKEELIARFRELGLVIRNGVIELHPQLLSRDEFLTQAKPFHYLRWDNQPAQLNINRNELAFTYCQVPFVYRVTESDDAVVTVHMQDGSQVTLRQLTLPGHIASALFERKGLVHQVEVQLPSGQLRAW
ncbi:hypothetical protein [Vibrio sp.]|uniref:hypothetical protein n=1 Tax=Vibrio sp. TaxID=678 RepID=UPI003D0B1D2C